MPRRSAPPISRRDRPAKPALTYEGIVATAVRLMQAEGLQRVTMRRLAQELDTGAASLYVYVANTAELHAAILEDLLGALDLKPTPVSDSPTSNTGNDSDTGNDDDTDNNDKEPSDWREHLVALLISYTRLLFEHPALARSALVARPSGSNYLALLEAILTLLHEGEVPDAQAAWGVDVLLQVATATAAEQSVRDEDDAAEAEFAAVVDAVRNTDPSSHPRLAAIGDDLFSGEPEERLSWTFRVLINGALATPRVPGH
jgi:AcrR family transcriptional regulator